MAIVLAVQRAEPGDEAAGRLVLGAGEHAGLDERAGVDDGVDALAGGQPTALVDLGDGLGTGVVVGPRPLGVQRGDRLLVHRLPPVLGQRLGRRHAGGAQRGDLVVAETEQLAQHLVGVLRRSTAPVARSPPASPSAARPARATGGCRPPSRSIRRKKSRAHSCSSTASSDGPDGDGGGHAGGLQRAPAAAGRRGSPSTPRPRRRPGRGRARRPGGGAPASASAARSGRPIAAHSRRQSSSSRHHDGDPAARPGRHGYSPCGHSPGRSLPRRSGSAPVTCGLHQLAGDVGRQRLDLAEVDVVALAGARHGARGRRRSAKRAHRARPSRR